MKSIGKKLILISFILAILASVSVLGYLQSLKKPQKEANKKITVLVAAETIPARTIITNKMIKQIQVSEDSIFMSYIKDSSMIIGKYAKNDILQNEGFFTDKLVDKNGNELSYKVEDNHRAISINAAGDSGVSDLIKPGDYVDVIVFLAEKKDGTKVLRPDEAKTIIQNVMVLAVDTEINRNDKQVDKIPANFFVAVSIPTSEIEKMVLAESMGNIKLVLRPLNKENDSETKGITGDELITSSSVVDKDNAPVQNISATTGEQVTSNTDSGNNTGSNTPDKYGYYKIKSGDSLRQISMNFYGDVDKYILIKQANNIENENQISVGDVIKIPILP